MIHKLTISLRQHTPLIHFQHDQEGATLRASEVKPKLDRFVIKQAFHDSFDECKEFLIGYNPDPEKKEESIRALRNKWNAGYRALDYKIRIKASDNRDEYMLTSYIKSDNIQILKRQGITAVNNTPYFAQEKQNSQIIKSKKAKEDWDKIEKKGVLFNGLICITIVSQKNNLLSIVSTVIQPYFLVTNFGARQSKGFGCFSTTKIELDGKDVAQNNIETQLKQNFLFVYKKTLSQVTIETILSTINDDYRLLKSGRTRPYAKSKESYTLLCKDENKRNSYASSNRYYYYRALLGLAEQFEFLLENPPMGDRKNKMIVKVKNNEIQRYQSPLLFKVFDNTIYLVGNEVAPEMLNKPFHFLVNFQKDRSYIDEPIVENGTPIFTPSNFSLKDFLAFAMNDNTNRATLGYTTIKK